jgi:dTDP-4-amino-4,6-dideoxygalactose transaminase
MGEELEKFETALAERLGRRRAIGVSSGSDAVYLALKALDLNAGDEVITTSLSWIATANAISRCGLVPVFCDVGNDLNMDPDSVHRLISKQTRAILSVDFTGRMCDYDRLLDICDQHKLYLVEDGSQAFGAKRNNHSCGKVGIISAISHNPMKVFSALGEAGSVLTDSDALADRVEMLRYNGTVNREICIEPSLNARMDSLQAAFLTVRLKNYESVLDRRLKNFQIYASTIKHNNMIDFPTLELDEIHSFYTLTLRVKRRDELMNHLSKMQIETKIQHPILMCDQRPYSRCTAEKEVASKIVKELLSIPIHQKLSPDEICRVSHEINQFYS